MNEVSKLRCPRCDGALEDGYVIAGGPGLRWSYRRVWTFFGTERLGGFPWVRSAALPAGRCRTCQLGVFSYSGRSDST